MRALRYILLTIVFYCSAVGHGRERERERKKSLSKKGNGNTSDVRVHASTYTTLAEGGGGRELGQAEGRRK